MRVKLLSLILSMCCAASAPAQPETAAKQQRIAELKASITKNQAALKSYAWTETTQISLKGEVKKQQQNECQYGPDGKVQKTPLGGDSPQPQQGAGGRRGGRFKQRMIQKKVGETKDYMERVAALIHEYAPPDPQKIQAAAAAGNVSVTPAQPVSMISIHNYLKQGDSLTFGFDTVAKKLTTYSVDSYLDDPKDDRVKLSVTFAQLPDGTSHVQESLLDATAKKIQVHVTNSGYKKIEQQ